MRRRFHLNRNSWSARRVALATVVGLLIVATAAGAFLAGRFAGEEEPAQAEPRVPAGEVLPIDNVPPIDTSKPSWDEPFYAAWRELPRYDQVINGIRVGPTVEITGLICGHGEATPAQPGDERGTPLEISPAYLPVGGRIRPPMNGPGDFVRCGGRLAVASLEIGIAAAPDTEARLAAGESWFVVPHGGVVAIAKRQYRDGAQPGVQASIPATNWQPATIAGLPAAVGRPILDAGLGTGVVVVWNADTDVVTILQSFNLSLAELLKVAEGVAK